MLNIFILNNVFEKSVFSEETVENCSGETPSELIFGPPCTFQREKIGKNQEKVKIAEFFFS